MSRNCISVKEETLHKLWAKNIFATEDLRTEKGEKISIISPGELNVTDGPDFVHAKIRISSITHYGSIEIHTQSKDWYAHKHHLDSNYSSVILHVVAENKHPIQVKSSSGYFIPTVNLYQSLSKFLYFNGENTTSTDLLCEGLIPSVSSEVFKRQVEKAQKEYFGIKVDTFFRFIDEHKTPSLAWKNALFINLCDGLGVSHNREQMVWAAREIIRRKTFRDNSDLANSTNLLHSLLLEIKWNSKGQRSSTQAHQRLEQALKLFTKIEQMPLDDFFTLSPSEIWVQLLEGMGLKDTKHNKRLYVAFLLPSLYGLGQLFYSKPLMEHAYMEWINSQIEVPNFILKKFGIFKNSENAEILKRIGLVHQFNAYCKPKQCDKCKVLINAISS